MTTTQFYDEIESAFGYKLTSDGARVAFYDAVNEQTGASNGEMCRATRNAVVEGIKPRGEYGRVTTADMVFWIKAIRKKNEVKGNEFKFDDWTLRLISDWSEKFESGKMTADEIKEACYRLPLKSSAKIGEVCYRITGERVF